MPSLKIPASEHAHQAAIFQWAELHQNRYPALRWLYAIPNAGKRSVVMGARMKAEGLRSGVPDMHLPVPRGPYHGLFIENKIDRKRPSQNQRRWLDGLTGQQNLCVVSWDWQEAVMLLESYVKGINIADAMLMANHHLLKIWPYE